MNAPILIVDGYNIIGAWEDLKELRDVDLGSAREQLISILGAYCPWHWERIIIVFDGRRFNWEHINDVEVVFTDGKETADTLIERLAAGLVSCYRVEVATSDFAEFRAASAVGATVLSASSLKERLAEQRDSYNRLAGSPDKKGLTFNGFLHKSVLEAMERLRRRR